MKWRSLFGGTFRHGDVKARLGLYYSRKRAEEKFVKVAVRLVEERIRDNGGERSFAYAQDDEAAR
jgi:hypothetical protein